MGRDLSLQQYCGMCRTLPICNCSAAFHSKYSSAHLHTTNFWRPGVDFNFLLHACTNDHKLQTFPVIDRLLKCAIIFLMDTIYRTFCFITCAIISFKKKIFFSSNLTRFEDESLQEGEFLSQFIWAIIMNLFQV
jgi:hypothetical protein